MSLPPFICWVAQRPVEANRPHIKPAKQVQEVDVDNGLDQDIFEINEELGLNLVEGDMRIDKKIDRSSIIGAKYRWPKTIPYYLEDSLNINAKGVILKAFEQYRLKSCIDFKPWTGEANYISIFKGSGCWSSVGNQHEGRQELSIGEGCERIGTIEHEFLHALGFWHEQSRADRDDYVTIVWDRIENGKEHNFNKYNDKESSDLNIPYDYTSVMHYSSTAFNNGTEPTIVTKIEEFSDVIGQRLDFSDYDVLRLHRLYNCSSSLSFLDRCSFEVESICGMIQGRENNAVWERVTQAPSGPDQDHTNMGSCAGIGYFMYFSTSTGLVGNNTLLESRIYYPKRGFQCLEFYSFNSGSENDKLNIWVRVYNEANPNGTLTKIIGMKGTGLNYWQLHHVSLAVTDKFRVVFEGVKGTGSSTGGISIDDINLSEMHCPTHVWHIKNFTHLLNTSPSGEAGKIYSPRYHSSDGYAFQIALYVNGTSRRPFYLAIYFHLVSGVNDENLQWPCPWKQGTMLLMDQHPDIRRRMSHQRSVTTDPSEGNQTFHIWDRPDVVGDLVTESDGTMYHRGPGKGTEVFLSHERLKSREFIKGDGAYFLLTMEDVSHLVGPQPTPSSPTPTSPSTPSAKPTTGVTDGSATEPSAEIPGLCTDFQCQNEGICVVDNGEPVCRCTTGTDWWYSGKYCETRGKQEDTVVIAVVSSISVFLVMLIITLLSVYCLRRKYQKMGKNDRGQGMGLTNQLQFSLESIGFLCLSALIRQQLSNSECPSGQSPPSFTEQTVASGFTEPTTAPPGISPMSRPPAVQSQHLPFSLLCASSSARVGLVLVPRSPQVPRGFKRSFWELSTCLGSCCSVLCLNNSSAGASVASILPMTEVDLYVNQFFVQLDHEEARSFYSPGTTARIFQDFGGTGQRSIDFGSGNFWSHGDPHCNRRGEPQAVNGTPCGFGHTLTNRPRERLLCGVKGDATQRRLLTEMGIDFKHTLEVSLAVESAAKDSQALQHVDNAALLQRGAGSCHRAGVGKPDLQN
ncbi:meprin A subunit beta-like [Cetorhinus maximus]